MRHIKEAGTLWQGENSDPITPAEIIHENNSLNQESNYDLTYHAKQLGKGLLVFGAGLLGYVGFNAFFGRRRNATTLETGSSIEGNDLALFTTDFHKPTKITEALSTTPLSFSATGKTLLSINENKAISNNLNDGLVAYYPFNGNANDESDNANHGTVHGATLTTDRFGISNSAYSFNGITHYIKASANNLPTAERTISLWFYANSVTNRPVLLAYGGKGLKHCGMSWMMGINNLGAASYHLQSHCNVNRFDYYYPQAPVGNWHHWTITTNIGGTKIYVDGEEKNSNSNFISNTAVTGKDLSFGVAISPNGIAPYTDGNINYFNGNLDDIRIYNRALSEKEIQQLYDYEWTAKPDINRGMVANYPFNGNANDESGNGNNGVVHGATLTEDRFGNAKSAYSFNGVDDYIDLGYREEFMLNRNFAVSIWIKPGREDPASWVLWNGPDIASSKAWMICLDQNRKISFEKHGFGNKWLEGPSVVVNKWSNIIVQVKNDGDRGYLYVDGTSYGSTDKGIPFRLPNPSQIFLGQRGPKNSAPFQGVIDDLRIYNRVLSNEEIKILYEMKNDKEIPVDKISWYWITPVLPLVGCYVLGVVGTSVVCCMYVLNRNKNKGHHKYKTLLIEEEFESVELERQQVMDSDYEIPDLLVELRKERKEREEQSKFPKKNKEEDLLTKSIKFMEKENTSFIIRPETITQSNGSINNDQRFFKKADSDIKNKKGEEGSVSTLQSEKKTGSVLSF